MSINWKAIKWFKPSEFNYPDKLEPELLDALDIFRTMVNRRIFNHSDYRPGDSGQHGLGKAVDIHIEGLHVIDQYFLAEKSGLFTGIGVYPYWNNPGIHLDIRTLSAGQAGSRWLRNAAGIYVGLNWQNIRILSTY